MSTNLEVNKTIAGGFISQIEFNDRTKLSVAENDIVVFVGPNNAGKSQALKDIYDLTSKQTNTVIVKNVTIEKHGDEELKEYVSKNLKFMNDTYYGCNFSFHMSWVDAFKQNKMYGELRNAFVIYLNTETRLAITNPPDAINSDDIKTHPIHSIAYNPNQRVIVSNLFKKAFNIDLIPHTQFGKTIPLCMGKSVNLEGNFEDEQNRLEKYRDVLNSYPQIHKQGDGIRSFTGILLNLVYNNYRTYLIDEPESFLHPPQANIMGRIIGEVLDKNNQAFISTHSQEIIKGLLETCPERVKIVRITRDEDTNHFSILENEKFEDIWKDPLLKYSEIMNSLFHKSVVLCESDSDCKLYSIILSHIKEKTGQFSETLFIHCGGKQRMLKVISALRSLNINLIVVPDIDVLNNEYNIKHLVESCGASWVDFEKDFQALNANLNTTKSQINRQAAKTKIGEIFNTSNEKYLSKSEIDQITTEMRTETKWNNVKKGGIDSIPAGDGYNAFKKIENLLQKSGIYLVPVGELENFVKQVGGHGPEWVNKVLETFPDLNNETYDKISTFIYSWNL